jgi:hypothetical protein
MIWWVVEESCDRQYFVINIVNSVLLDGKRDPELQDNLRNHFYNRAPVFFQSLLESVES